MPFQHHDRATQYPKGMPTVGGIPLGTPNDKRYLYHHDYQHPDGRTITVLFAGKALRAFEFDAAALYVKSPYWQTMFESNKGSMPSAEERSWPDCDEPSMALFSEWVDGKKLGGPTNVQSNDYYVGLWVLAQKFECEALQNHVMDLVRRFYRTSNQAGALQYADFIMSYPDDRGQMQRFLTVLTAFRALTESRPDGKGASGPTYLPQSARHLLASNPALADELEEATIRLAREGLPDPRRGLQCNWHVHEKTPACPLVRLEPWQTEE